MLNRVGKFLSKTKWALSFCLIFVVYRIPLLGFDIINIDAPVWKSRTFQFSSAILNLDFSKTAVTYHPGVSLMWVCGFGAKLYSVFAQLYYKSLDYGTIRDYVGLHFTQKLMIILCLAVFLYFILVLLDRIFSKPFASLFFFGVMFEPYFLGLTRVMHTDGLVTFSSFLTLLSLYYYVEISRKKFWFFLSSFSCAFALLTKSNSLILFAFIVFILALYFWFSEKKSDSILNIFTKYFKFMAFYSASMLLFFIFLWPAMWVSPLETLELYYKGIVSIGLEPHSQIWMGSEIDSPGFNYYPVVLFIRTTPWFLFISLSGVLLFLNGLRTKALIKNKKLFILSFLFVCFYTLILSESEKKLGRYILPVLPFLGLFFSFFVIEFIKAVAGLKKHFSLYAYSLSGIFLLLGFISAYNIFPNYLMYYSPLIGGYSSGSIVEDPKWPVGYGDLAKFLNSLPNAKNRYVLVRYGYLYNPFNLSHSTGTLSQKTEKDPGAFFVLEKYSDFRYLRGKGESLKYVLSVGGVDMFYIYEIMGDYEVTENYKFIIPSGINADPNWK